MIKRMTIWAVALVLSACEPGPEPSNLTEDDDPANDSLVNAWIVEAVEPIAPADVEEAARTVISGDITIELLFPEDSGLDGIYIIKSSEAVSELEALDIMYLLKDLPEFSDAAPDFQVHEPLIQRAAAAACKAGAGAAPIPGEKGWSLDHMNVEAAWALDPKPGGKSQGEGVTICHPDTGWADHVDLDSGALDLANSTDLIDGGDGKDPLNYRGNPGHGTATGSVLISRGGLDSSNNTTAPGQVTGVAPKAKIVPIRTIHSVVRFLDSNTARAVNYARGPYCDVVSMSLGGAGFFGLKKAIRKAVEEDNKIIVSAAGNCVGFIVAPASYRTTIAAAASNSQREPWKGSSKGSAVTMTAPGEGVYVARRNASSTDLELVEPSNGTSYATTAIAAAAANWIAFHGKDALNDAKGTYPLSDLFRWALDQSGDPPADWDTSKYGPGILDLEKLLKVDITQFPKDQPRTVARESALLDLADMIDRSPAQTRGLLRHLFGDGDPDDLARIYGAELQRLTITNPELVMEILGQVERRLPRTAINSDITDNFSSRMRAAAEAR